jgi:hypothetical protein
MVSSRFAYKPFPPILLLTLIVPNLYFWCRWSSDLSDAIQILQRQFNFPFTTDHERIKDLLGVKLKVAILWIQS